MSRRTKTNASRGEILTSAVSAITMARCVLRSPTPSRTYPKFDVTLQRRARAPSITSDANNTTNRHALAARSELVGETNKKMNTGAPITRSSDTAVTTRKRHVVAISAYSADNPQLSDDPSFISLSGSDRQSEI